MGFGGSDNGGKFPGRRGKRRGGSPSSTLCVGGGGADVVVGNRDSGQRQSLLVGGGDKRRKRRKGLGFADFEGRVGQGRPSFPPRRCAATRASLKTSRFTAEGGEFPREIGQEGANCRSAAWEFFESLRDGGRKTDDPWVEQFLRARLFSERGAEYSTTNIRSLPVERRARGKVQRSRNLWGGRLPSSVLFFFLAMLRFVVVVDGIFFRGIGSGRFGSAGFGSNSERGGWFPDQPASRMLSLESSNSRGGKASASKEI